MAILTNPNKMEFSGKLGDKVGVRGKYGHYIRSLAKKSTKPPTERQLAVRMQFTLINSFLSPLRDLIEKVYENRKNKKMSAFNLAISDNIKMSVGGEYPDLFIDYTRLQMSRGCGPKAWGARMLLEDDGMLVVSWDKTTDPCGHYRSAVPVIVLYYQESGYYKVEWTQQNLHDLQVRLRPESEKGQTIHAWLFFVSEMPRETSGTVYAGKVNYKF